MSGNAGVDSARKAARIANEAMRILATTYTWRLPKRNRELQVPLDLAALRHQYPDVAITPIREPGCTLAGNGIYAVDAVLQRIAPRWKLRKTPGYFDLTHSTVLPSRRLVAGNFDLVFAHESFPVNWARCPVPIIVQTRMPTDECRAVYGLGPEYNALEFAVKSKWVTQAAAIVVATPGDRQRLMARLPFPSGKCVVIPPYLPWLKPVTEEDLIRKQSPQPKLSVLFVGNEAKRKGIDQFAEAWRRLPMAVTRRIEVVVVSRFLDGSPDLQGLPWAFRRDIAQHELNRLFRESQVLLLPTHADTFGNVLVEGMSAGCCVVSSRRSPQDWILDEGRAGMLVEPSEPDSIGAALESLLDADRRRSLALNGFRRYQTVFDHRVTGRQYYEEFRRVLQSSERNGPDA